MRTPSSSNDPPKSRSSETRFISIIYLLFDIYLLLSYYSLYQTLGFCPTGLRLPRTAGPHSFLARGARDSFQSCMKNTSSVMERRSARVLTCVYYVILCLPIGSGSEGPDCLRLDPPICGQDYLHATPGTGLKPRV